LVETLGYSIVDACMKHCSNIPDRVTKRLFQLPPTTLITNNR
jgi:hypothetical protein